MVAAFRDVGWKRLCFRFPATKQDQTSRQALGSKFTHKRQQGETAAEYLERKRRFFERKRKAGEVVSRLPAIPGMSF